MNYELAKKLKDAGFPKETFIITEPSAKYPNRYGQKGTPTLSELIEACGKGFRDLSIRNGSWMARWQPKDDGRGWMWRRLEGGNTPEEAVANLWLKLKEK